MNSDGTTSTTLSTIKFQVTNSHFFEHLHSDWFNQIYADFIKHYDQGAIGSAFFEWSDEEGKDDPLQKTMGAIGLVPAVDAQGRRSTQDSVWIADGMVKKDNLYEAIRVGTFQGKQYNWNADPFVLLERAPLTLDPLTCEYTPPPPTTTGPAWTTTTTSTSTSSTTGTTSTTTSTSTTGVQTTTTTTGAVTSTSSTTGTTTTGKVTTTTTGTTTTTSTTSSTTGVAPTTDASTTTTGTTGPTVNNPASTTGVENVVEDSSAATLSIFAPLVVLLFVLI